MKNSVRVIFIIHQLKTSIYDYVIIYLEKKRHVDDIDLIPSKYVKVLIDTQLKLQITNEQLQTTNMQLHNKNEQFQDLMNQNHACK